MDGTGYRWGQFSGRDEFWWDAVYGSSQAIHHRGYEDEESAQVAARNWLVVHMIRLLKKFPPRERARIQKGLECHGD